MGKKILIGVVLVMVAVLSVFAFKINQFYKKIYSSGEASSNKNIPKTSYSILLLGYGGGQHEGTYLTDSMILLHFDTASKKLQLISVPRDIWVKIPTRSGADFHAKINAAYQMGMFPGNYPDLQVNYRGDGKLVKYAVSQITGLSVDHYVALDFQGFVKAIDILGGINIDVKYQFEDKEYPIDGKERDLCGNDGMFKKVEPIINKTLTDPKEIDQILNSDPSLREFYNNITDKPYLAFPCRYEDFKVEAGNQHMDGKLALKFVRSRHGIGDGSDFGRSARQQLFLEAVKEKVISMGLLTKIIPLMDELKDDLRTDVDLVALQKMVKEAKNFGAYQTKSVVLSDTNYLSAASSSDGQYILIPKEGIDRWDNVKRDIYNIFSDIIPSPVSSPSASLKKIKKT